MGASSFLLVALAVPFLPAQGSPPGSPTGSPPGPGPIQRGVMLYEELRNLTERNMGACIRYPSGQECNVLCRRMGFQTGRCHRRECFCLGPHCLDGSLGTTRGPSSTTRNPLISTRPPASQGPTGWTVDWPTDASTEVPMCPHDIGGALCNMGCVHFCRASPGQVDSNRSSTASD